MSHYSQRYSSHFDPYQQVRPSKKKHSFLSLLVTVIAFIVFASIYGLFQDLTQTFFSPDRRPYPDIPYSQDQPNQEAPDHTVPGPTTDPNPGGTVSTWQSEDYIGPGYTDNPSEIPFPRSAGEAETWAGSNVFYQAVMKAPIRCEIELPKGDITRSTRQMDRYLNDLTGCLVKAWGPVLESTGYSIVRPRVIVFSGSEVQSPCGRLEEMNAYYCAADQNIYYSMSLPRIFPQGQFGTLTIPEQILAHEFGHSVQGRTGLFGAFIYLENSEPNPTRRLETSRRLELQADCFAGMFTQAVRASFGLTSKDIEERTRMFASLGDGATGGDHGIPQSRSAWYLNGVNSTSAQMCNTFTAPSQRVP